MIPISESWLEIIWVANLKENDSIMSGVNYKLLCFHIFFKIMQINFRDY